MSLHYEPETMDADWADSTDQSRMDPNEKPDRPLSGVATEERGERLVRIPAPREVDR